MCLPPRRQFAAWESIHGDAVDFLEARHPVTDLVQPRLPQVPDAFLRRLLGNRNRAAALHDNAADLLGDRHDLIDSDPTLIPVRALRATDGPENLEAIRDFVVSETLFQERYGRDIEVGFTIAAKSSCEPLSDDQADRRRDRVGLDAHVHQAGERLGRVVRVQRGQHKVTGLGRLHRDLGSLEVADLADHDDVRILAQEGAQGSRKGESHLRVDIHLVDTAQHDFDRIFGGRDVAVLDVQDIQTRIERHRLAAAGRSRYQDHPMRAIERREIVLLLEDLVAERVDPEHRARRIENSHHDLLTEERRAGAHAEVDGPGLRDLHLDAAVLGDAPLGDIEPGHDLEPRGELARQNDRRCSDFLQHTVEPEADAVGALVRLEVNVRGAAPDRVQHHLVHEADDGCVVNVGALADIARYCLLARADIEGVHLEVLAGELGHGRIDLLERLVDELGELVLFDDDRLDGITGRELDLVQRVEVGRVRHSNEQPLAALDERQYAVLAQQLLADQPHDLQVGLDRIEVQQRYAKLLGGADGDLARLRQVVLDQVADDCDPALPGGGDRRQHVALADQPVRHQALRQALQGLAEGGGGGGEVVHGRGIGGVVSGHLDAFIILTGDRRQLLNRLELSANRSWRNRTPVTTRGPGRCRAIRRHIKKKSPRTRRGLWLHPRTFPARDSSLDF